MSATTGADARAVKRARGVARNSQSRSASTFAADTVGSGKLVDLLAAILIRRAEGAQTGLTALLDGP